MINKTTTRLSQQSIVIDEMAKAAFAAGRGLIRDFSEVEQLQVSIKGPSNFVSNADLIAEKTIQYKLSQFRPTYGYVMEESGVREGENPNYYWIIDPLDGTTNFLHSIPHFAISIALQQEQEIIAAVVFDPIKNELFWAEKGRGAYLNNTRLRVSRRNNLGHALIGSSFTRLHPNNHKIMNYYYSNKKITTMRHSGSSVLDLCYVAAGRLEGVWEFELPVWDYAAGALLVTEAGGVISDCHGSKQATVTMPTGSDRIDSLVASNGHLHSTLLKFVNCEAD